MDWQRLTWRLRLALDILAVLCLAAGLALIPVVLSFDPADQPGATVLPANPTPNNFAGWYGAWIARQLADALGLGTYPALVSWFMLSLTLLLEGRRGLWCWRLLGWMILVPGVSLLAEVCHLAGPMHSAYGPGGLLGVMLNDWLSDQFTAPGTYLVLGALLTFGLAFAGDAVWPPLFRLAIRRWNLYRQRVALRRAEEAERRRRLAQSAPPADKTTPETPPAPSLPSVAVTRKPPPVHHPAPLPARIPKNDYQLPPFDLLDDPEPFPYEQIDQFLRERAVKLEQTFADFGLNVRVVGINTGPVITQFEVALETGLRLQKVTRLADDIALNLKVPSVRMVAPIPGKDTVGVEIPNEHRAVVRLKEVILNAGDRLTKYKIPLFLGKDTEGKPLVYDLADMPHLLIAGRTGTGKSVCMNAIILSILMTRRPSEVKMIMIDPKMLELSEYGKIPHLMHPVVKDMRKAEAILGWAVDKMEERYDILSRARVRNIAGYNELGAEEIYRRLNPADEEEQARIPEKMPYIVIFVDEMNDLMMTMRKEVEGHIIRLAQKSRAAGIHLVVATQKPTVDVITGLIKSNLPARICFQVSSRTDSRVVLDEMGAEKLLGKGDMLFLQPGTSTIVRAQGTYASDAEITRVCNYLECEPVFSQELIQLSTAARSGKDALEAMRQRDELYEAAVEIVVRERRGSTSLLQRALGIGYGRAARLIDYMAEDGIVGPYNGSNAREVLMTPEQWES
ncbi:MAG: DNA translocase FtsK, partial [Gemmatales bacterium]|nr:DNA translocase FtsK [Gemmatales bacterium]MDW8387849.1 DNA translocase FtsK [Gemmatales bacterium]